MLYKIYETAWLLVGIAAGITFITVVSTSGFNKDAYTFLIVSIVSISMYFIRRKKRLTK